ncbi:MAG: VanW family protein [Armatimonadota bacterium]
MRITHYIRTFACLMLTVLVVLGFGLRHPASGRKGELKGFPGWNENTHSVAHMHKVAHAEVSDLLWCGSIPLEHQGEDMRENVRLAAAAVDLSVVHPGEVFSFNNTVGVRTEGKGYRPGLMYSSGKVVTGIGGGICIVSTLLYRAALETGLKILERRPHSGRVSYAEPGLDSAVAFGSADLAFKNNTGTPIYIRAVVEDDVLAVSIFGAKKPGRIIEVVTENYQEIPFKIIETEDPEVPEGEVAVDQKAVPGFTVTTLRIIKEGVRVVSREVVSRDEVAPRDKIMRVPPVSIPAVEPLPSLPAVQGIIRLQESEPGSDSSAADADGRRRPATDRTNSTASE